MTSVRRLRVNPHAGSTGVHYDTGLRGQADLLAVLQQAGCVGAASRSDEVSRKEGELLGKALVGAIVQKAGEHSARTRVGAFT